MTLRLPQNLEDQIRSRAAREKIPMSKVIEHIIAAHFEDDDAPMTDRQARIIAATAVAGVRYAKTMERLA
jgi:hypothetical protein